MTMFRLCAAAIAIGQLPGLALTTAPAAAQTAPTPPGNPAGPDPDTRAMVAKALAQVASTSITKTMIVGTDVLGTPPVGNDSGTVGHTPIQVNGGDPTTTGYLGFRYGNDGAGVANYWVKTRGTKMNDYAAVQLGDRIVSDFWQAGTGGQTGHVGGAQVVVDTGTFTAGEVGGRWVLFTGTGIHRSQATPQYPNRFGSINAIVANSYQQVLFPGGLGGATTPRPGSNFGGWVVIGAGASQPGFGALKFLSANAVLLTTPEAGALEVDAGAKPYFTTADGVRRSIVLADTAMPTVKALAGAGAGATVGIDANGHSGTVTLVAGAGKGGDLFTVTYAHPYGSASYPVISAANAASVALVRNAYLTASASGFTLSLPSGITAGTTYVVTFYAPGK